MTNYTRRVFCSLLHGLDCAVEVAVYQCLLPWLPLVFSYLQDVLLCGTSEPVRITDGAVFWYSSHWEGQCIFLHAHFQDSALPSLDDMKLFRSAIDSLYHFLVSLNHSFQVLSDIGPTYLMRKATEYLVTFDFSKVCLCLVHIQSNLPRQLPVMKEQLAKRGHRLLTFQL